MSDEDDEAPAGAPMWMATFADLMSLLMCFFVLILSFSEMDVIKYKQIADSMRDAFGVQQQFEFDSIPKGTSIVATQFQPGKPEPTPLDVVQQQTTNQDMNSLELGKPDVENPDAQDVRDQIEKEIAQLIEETEMDAEKLRELLSEEIASGQLDVENENRTIVIRIREKGSFPSGSAVLDLGFFGILDRISVALNDIEGNISIEGHTDSVPMSSAAYASNWDLSAARAVSVANQMLANTNLPPGRITVSGFADTRPQASNETWEGRAENRRVEIVVKQPLEESDNSLINQLRSGNPEALDALDVNNF
jgi:chemotaxis protein MotB